MSVILRIESPENLTKLFSKQENAQTFAEEFNKLLEYFKSREEDIEKTNPDMSRYAGFALSSAIVALSMVIVNGTSEKISANILRVSQSLKQMPGSGSIVFLGDQNNGKPN